MRKTGPYFKIQEYDKTKELNYSLASGTNFLMIREFPNTAESLITHPSVANAGVRRREFVIL
jgi:hypothetical protein